jgi:hypothetical protein
MSVTGGIFNETRLLQQINRADQMALDGRIKQQYIPKIDMLRYIQSLQNPSLNVAFNTRPKKDYDVEINWVNTCEDFTIPDISCERGGPEPSTNAVQYTLYKRITKGFTIYDSDYRDNQYDADETIAKTMIQIDKQICEEFAQYCTAQLNFFSGVNQVTDGKGVINQGDNTITDIAPNDWTAELMAYFARVMILNRFDNAAMISGSNLFETLYTADAMKANSDGKGDAILWGGLPIWFDLFNVDGVNAPDYFTYLVSQNATALVNKAWNPAMARYFDHMAYTMRSRFFPGFTYDVFYDNRCDDANRYRDTVLHNYKIVLTAELFKNPFGCDALEDGKLQFGGVNSGILRFRNRLPVP